MDRVTIVNKHAISSQNPLHGQAFNDVENHLSNHLALIQALQKQVEDLKAALAKK